MTIIVLYILLGIIALIVILLHFSVRATIKASKQGAEIKVKWLFFTLYPRKPKKPKKSKKNKGEAETADEQPESQKVDLSEESLEEFIKQAEQTSEPPEQSDEPETSPEKESDTTQAPEKTDKQQAKKAKKEKRKKQHTPDIEPAEGKKEKGKLAQLKDKFNMVKPYIPLGWKYFRKILKKIRITDVQADVTVGKEDAYEAALWYGKVQGFLFSTMGWLGCIFTIKLKRLDVHCEFNEKVMDGEIYLKVKIRPSTMIHIAFCMAIKALCIFIRQKKEQKLKAQAARKRHEQQQKQQQKKAA
ncbi:MAG: hypothetical protein II703_04175 [Ruminococcus sp.]|nr:hypothetical protein [Ruminococcus sp.]